MVEPREEGMAIICRWSCPVRTFVSWIDLKNLIFVTSLFLVFRCTAKTFSLINEAGPRCEPTNVSLSYQCHKYDFSIMCPRRTIILVLVVGSGEN